MTTDPTVKDFPPGRRCVVYVAHGKEKRTAWFSTRDRAQRALKVIRHRYSNGIIYVD